MGGEPFDIYTFIKFYQKQDYYHLVLEPYFREKYPEFKNKYPNIKVRYRKYKKIYIKLHISLLISMGIGILLSVMCFQPTLKTNLRWFMGIAAVFAFIYVFIKLRKENMMVTEAKQKWPEGITLSYLKFVAISEYLKNKNITREDLERIQNILIKEEKENRKDFLSLGSKIIILPGIIIAGITRYFNGIPFEKLGGAVAMTVSISFLVFGIICFIYKLYKIAAEREADQLRSVIRYIDKLLINGYGRDKEVQYKY